MDDMEEDEEAPEEDFPAINDTELIEDMMEGMAIDDE
jgi:hypothetical protein